MMLRDKELEDRIEEVGNKLTTPPSDVQQLLLLLDKAENFLSRVEQCPPQSMHAALEPSLKALVTRDLLRHSDLDVKIAVASCLSEITRITAPDAPYDDDLMKEIFGLIVGAFKNLDEMSSRSFSKRVSILETVAKVRSCVLMLDLECDDLILDMFHHFLKTIRPKHSDTVFSSMETVMTLVIEESENISTRLLLCLLDHLKIDEKNIMSSAKKLAEKVLANCALKLKPYLAELFKGICAPLSDYSKIVAVVCQGNLGASMQNEMNTSGETQADDSKLSDRTLCDELPQGSAKQEHKVLEKAVADADGSSKSVMSNGTFQMGNGDSMASEQKAEFSQPGVQLRDTGGSRLVDSDNLGSGAAKLDSGLNLSSRKGRKRKALGKLSVNNDHSQIDDKNEAPASTGRRKGRSKEADLSQVDGLSFKEVETAACSKPGKKNKLEPTPGLADVATSVSLHTPNELEGIHSRKGRLPLSKPSRKRNAADKAAVDGSSSPSGRRGLLESSQTTVGDLPMRELSSKKSEVISESERNLLKCSAGKSHTCAEDSKTTPTAEACDSATKNQRHRGRSGSQREVREVDFSGKKQSAGTKQRKGGDIHVDEEDKEVKLKELVSSRKSTMKETIKDPSLPRDINETKSRRKRARATQETFGTPKRRKSNEKLVGAKIRVWWPEDERFYDGVVESFDRSTKKHKILYNDGDVEVLLLKKENWEFIEDETKTGGVQENNTLDINASEVRNKKAKSRRGDVTSDKTKTDLPLKSPDSTIKTESNDKLSKRKARPQGIVLSDETHKKSSKERGKSANGHPNKRHKDNSQLNETANKSENEKLGENIKPDPSKSVDKADNDTSKSGDKVGTDTLKIRGKSKGDSSRSSMKSKSVGPKSRKKSGDAHDSGIKSEEGSPRTKSTESRRKSGERPAKGSSRKARGGMTPRSSRNLNANDMPKNDEPKVGESEARSTTGKKRKRGRLGR